MLILDGTMTNLESENRNGIYGIRFNIVSERFYRDRNGNSQKEESIFDVYAFGGLSKSVRTNFEKNKVKVRIVGRLKQDRWKDEDGETHSKVCVIAENIDFMPEVRREKKDMEMER